ncbi:MAG: DUF3667 domain-containing protein, partial [Pricia sp.]
DISDRYCPYCSQINSVKKPSLKDFFAEFFASIISYDSKLLKTLGALLLRPGKITREYIDGKRMSYTNPFRFLLSLAIIYFLMINFTGNFSDLDKFGKDKNSDFIESLDNYNLGDDATKNAKISQQLDSIKININYQDYTAESRRQDSLILSDPEAYHKRRISKDATFFEEQNVYQNFYTVLLRKDSIYDFEDAVTKYKVTETLGSRFAFNAANGMLALQSRPGSFVSALISKLPLTVFFFLPVFALFIWVVYIRKSYGYTDHLIFSFHNTALLFILLIISYLIDSIFEVTSILIFLMAFALYLFLAMRKFYAQGVFKTIVKYLSLNFIFFILSAITLAILFAGNIIVY